MRIDFKYASLPLLAALVVGCSGSADPDPAQSAPASEGESVFALDSADGMDVDKVGTREGAPEARRRRHHHHHGGGSGQQPTPPPVGKSCEVAGQTFPDGSAVPSGDSCNGCGCNDGSVLCTAVACEPVVCALFVELSDGVCSRFPLDPCISQDPDCLPDAGSCEVAGQTFPNGSSVPSGDSCNTCGCNDGSVLCTLALCEPVASAFFVEESDGVCSRFPLDPCQSQDPDCVTSSEPTEP
jgi:hypothetical protein